MSTNRMDDRSIAFSWAANLDDVLRATSPRENAFGSAGMHPRKSSKESRKPCGPSRIGELCDHLVDGAWFELMLTPKPGLVDLIDNGSHPDLSLDKMAKSIGLLPTYFAQLCQALDQGAPVTHCVQIGIQAERRMIDEIRTNAHRGYIFIAGLTLAAAWKHDGVDVLGMRKSLQRVASEVLAQGAPLDSHGGRTRAEYHVTGVTGEALRGFNSVFDAALPAFLSMQEQGHDLVRAGYYAMSVLMQNLEDTTALHRAGTQGLKRLRHDGVVIQRLMDQGGDPVPYMRNLKRIYCAMDLTMGGVADCLALTYALSKLCHSTARSAG